MQDKPTNRVPFVNDDELPICSTHCPMRDDRRNRCDDSGRSTVVGDLCYPEVRFLIHGQTRPVDLKGAKGALLLPELVAETPNHEDLLGLIAPGDTVTVRVYTVKPGVNPLRWYATGTDIEMEVESLSTENGLQYRLHGRTKQWGKTALDVGRFDGQTTAKPAIHRVVALRSIRAGQMSSVAMRMGPQLATPEVALAASAPTTAT